MTLDRVFLDANVLFSAAYAAENRFLALWECEDIRLFSSEYAVEEARCNLTAADHLERLNQLVAEIEIVQTPSATLPEHPPSSASLPAKDQPILAAAIDAHATHLLTGDRRHFGKLYGKRLGGVLIQPPAQYLQNRPRRHKGA
jgi:uncharacterized protein